MAATKVISSAHLATDECWMVQTWGISYCKTCSSSNTRKCGGKLIIRTGKNNLGYTVPLQDMSKE